MKPPDRTSERPVRIGVYGSLKAADEAVRALRALGFGPGEISLICPERLKEHFAGLDVEDRAGSHTPEAVAAGSSIGALLGGLGAAVLVTATGGMGLLIAGPLVAGTAAGAIAGGFVGAMTTRGVEREIADYYDQALQRDKILIAVEDEDAARLATAERAFAATGAEPIALPEG